MCRKLLLLLASLVFCASLACASPSPPPVSWADLSPEQQAAISSAESSLDQATQALDKSNKTIERQSTQLIVLGTVCVVLSVVDLTAVGIAAYEILRR